MKKKDFPHSPHTTRNIIWYDGVCNLCHWSVRFVKRHDKKGIFSYKPLQQQGEADPESIVYLRDKIRYDRSDAVLMILKELGGAWRWFYPLIIIPKSWCDGAYDLVARFRYRIFGRREICDAP